MIHNTTPARRGHIASTLSRWAAVASSLMVLGGAFGGCAAAKAAGAAPDPQLIHTDAEAQSRHTTWHQKEGQVVKVAGDHKLTGPASWYGKQFHGRLTANGEKFDMYSQTAAHKTLPLGTLVRVVRPDTRQSVVVRINDRGPYVGDRVIDLSYGAAQDLDMVAAGTAQVQVEVLEVGDNKYKRGGK